MARPHRKGLGYFNLDCLQEDNLNYIEAKHGLLGYAVVVKLWKKIYQLHGYYCEWNEKNVYLFAKDVNVSVETVWEIVQSCMDEGIFNRELFDNHRILTSRGIQKRWKKIVTEAKRKDIQIEEKYSLLEITREEAAFTTTETTINSPDNPQRKEKKIKEILTSAPERVVVCEKKKIERADGGAVVKTKQSFVKRKFSSKPSTADGEPRVLQSSVRKLQTLIKLAGRLSNATNAPKIPRTFLPLLALKNVSPPDSSCGVLIPNLTRWNVCQVGPVARPPSQIPGSVS